MNALIPPPIDKARAKALRKALGEDGIRITSEALAASYIRRPDHETLALLVDVISNDQWCVDLLALEHAAACPAGQGLCQEHHIEHFNAHYDGMMEPARALVETFQRARCEGPAKRARRF